MAIAVVNTSAVTLDDASGVCAITYSPSAGNACIVPIGQTVSAVRTYTVEDNIDGTTGWSLMASHTPGQRVFVFAKPNMPSGVTTITVRANTDTDYRAAVLEASGMGTVITDDAEDGLTEGSNTNNHTCSASGVTSANEVLAVCSAVLNSASGVTGCDAGTNWTRIGALQAGSLFQYRVFSSGATAEVGAWTNSGTARSGRSVIVLLSGNGGGSGGNRRRRFFLGAA